MSRLASLSPAALKAMFSTDSDDALLSLMTVTGSGVPKPIRICDGYTHKFEWLTSTSMTVTNVDTNADETYTYLTTDAALKDAINTDKDSAFYGVMSGVVPFLFLPFSLTLPTEEQSSVPRCSITMHDVTRMLMPVIRSISSAPSVDIDLVLTKTPGVIEVSFPGFLMGGIGYTADSITAELTVESYASEPFPCHTFTPSCFPRMF